MAWFNLTGNRKNCNSIQKNMNGKTKKKNCVANAGPVIVCILILSVIAGCIGQPENGIEGGPAVTDPDTLNILAYGEPDQLDPATCYDERGSLVIHNLYDRLMGYDSPDTKAINARLAEKWEISDDGMEYTFYLRKGATFHDGSAVNADAVKYSFDRVLKMNQPPSWMMAQCMDLNSTQVIDEYTVKITLTKPYAAFLPILCHTVASVVNPAAVEAHGGVEENAENEWLNQNESGAGSGPYEFVEWIPNERIVLKRYDNYWRGPAKLPNVKISFIPEIGTRGMYLKKGDADIATGFPETNIPEILGAEGVIVFAEPSYDITFIVLGCRGPLADKSVRQAVCMAMDYDTILVFVYHGYAEKLCNVVPSGMFGWHDVGCYEFDIEGANALLDDAGYTMDAATGYRKNPATGEILGAEIAVPQGDEVRSQIALLWQKNLSKIGFKLDIREITWAMMYKLIRNEETDMIISGWLPDYADPDYYTDSMCSSANAKAIWGSDYKNEELDSLIDQAKWETDRNARDDLYRQILLIIKEDAPFVWLAQTAHVEAHRLWVKGYFYNPCQSMEFWGIYKEETPEELYLSTYIEKKLDKLPTGSILFYFPKMKAGEEGKVKAMITKKSKNNLSEEDREKASRIEDIKISNYKMKVCLRAGKYFEITPDCNEEIEKVVLDEEFTTWEWIIMPEKSGTYWLSPEVSTEIIMPNGEKGYCPLNVEDEEVEVEINPIQFVEDNWERIATIIISSGIIAWLTKKFRGEKHSIR